MAVRKILRALLTVIVIVVFGTMPAIAQPLGFSIMNNKRKVEIPIEIHNNLVVVPLVLNESLPLKFILDTGVRTAILTQKSFSDILNLPYARKYTITGPGGEKMVDAYVTNNVSLSLPGVRGKGQAMLVLDQDYLELRNYLGTEVHGILGYELFSRFIVQVDYERRLLTLYAPNYYKKRKSFETVKIFIDDTKPYVDVPVMLANGDVITARLLVDSGASHPLLLDPLSDDKIVVPTNVISSTIGRGLGGVIMGKTGRIKSLGLGPYTIKDIVTNFPDANSYSDTTMIKILRNGTIGGGILSRFTVVFNFSREELYLRKNSEFKKKFHYNVSGLTVRTTGAGDNLDEFEVTEVRSGSSSDVAGLLVGDKILAINGIKSTGLKLNDVMGFLSQRPGRKVRMEILRDGKRIRKHVILSDQI
jgi:hypothetical protein